MGWAEAWEQHVRWQRIVTLVVIGGAVAAAGGWPMYSDTVHHLTGKPSTATLIGHLTECTVEYQRVGEDRRKEPMACDAAEAFQQRIGAKKVKVSAEHLALVRFSLADGRAHEAKVDERKLDTRQLPVGAKIAVVYAPDRPADVRAVLTWDRLKVSFGLFVAGIVVLLLTFATALLARAFASRPASFDNAPRPAVVVSGRVALPATGPQSGASFGRRG